MGLDMYLNRMPRYRGATPDDISAVESYLDWLKCKAEGSEHANCSFKEWCGRDKTPPKEYLEFYANYYKATYSDWDKEHKHPWMRIKEEVGYWRKANHIHNWFVEHIQDGEDDCEYHREVTKEDLEELLDVCKEVFESCKLVSGKVVNGYTFDEHGNKQTILEDGMYIEDPSVAEELLPTQGGFFFGSTDYDQYYIRDIEDTINIVTKVLETTDFDTQMVYYNSSW